MSFAQQSEKEQVEQLADLARAALPAWDLAGAAVDLIKYRENAVFRVTGADGRRRVLRVHRPRYRTDAHIRSEAAWMSALAEAEVPTPDFLRTRSGDVLTTAKAEGVPEPRQCDLLAWVDGAPLGTLEQGVDLDDAALHRSYETVGTIAARIHEHGERWPRPASFARPSWDLDTLIGPEPTFGRFEELEGLKTEQLRVLVRARDRAREALAALGPADQLIHGDLIPDNLLAEGSAVRVIDFDDCGWSWFGFELVTSLFPLLVSGGFEVGLDGFLAGYRARRTLPEAHLAAVPSLVMARALSYLGWPVGRPEIHSQKALIPFIAGAVTDLAERYLSGGL